MLIGDFIFQLVQFWVSFWRVNKFIPRGNFIQIFRSYLHTYANCHHVGKFLQRLTWSLYIIFWFSIGYNHHLILNFYGHERNPDTNLILNIRSITVSSHECISNNFSKSFSSIGTFTIVWYTVNSIVQIRFIFYIWSIFHKWLDFDKAEVSLGCSGLVWVGLGWPGLVIYHFLKMFLIIWEFV